MKLKSILVTLLMGATLIAMAWLLSSRSDSGVGDAREIAPRRDGHENKSNESLNIPRDTPSAQTPVVSNAGTDTLATAGHKPSKNSTIDRSFAVTQRQKDLFRAFLDASESGGIEGASTAAYLSSVCLPYAKGRAKPYPLPPALTQRLAVAGVKSIAETRDRLADEMYERCKGFGGQQEYASAMRKIDAQLRQAGVNNLFGQEGTGEVLRTKAKAIETVFQNPDSYLGVMMANTNEIFPRLTSETGAAPITDAEARLAFELGMCQLGSDCERGSISAMNACIVNGVCGDNTLQEKAEQLSRAFGFDFDRIARRADYFAAGVRRADSTILGTVK